MTIQLSVSVWTVICFCLLMLILHNLLFKPVLKIMDERRTRIEKAATKKAEMQRLEEEYAAMTEESKKAFKEEKKRQLKGQLEDVRKDFKRAVEAAQEERIRQVDEYRIKSESEHAEILSTLSVHADELAAAFADSLLR